MSGGTRCAFNRPSTRFRSSRRRLSAALAIASLAVPLLAAVALAHGRHESASPAVPPLEATGFARPPAAVGSLLPPVRVYIANDDHTDYMWSGDVTTYRDVFLNMLDYYMTQAETTAWRPPDFRGKFNTDGTLWLWVYERERTAPEFDRLIEHVRAGNITVPLNTCVELYGAMPAEAVLRSFSYAGRLERRENLRFPLVVPMENQTLPGGVASLFAGSGAKYAWKGICNCATHIDAGDRPREIYRFQGPDGQSVLMKWQRMYVDSRSIGGYAEARDPYTVVNFIDSDSDFLTNWPYTVAGAFGYGWDDLQSTTHELIDAAIQASDAPRRVIVSNEVDFFEDFEATHGVGLENYGACYGNEWDLYTASLAAVTSRVKRAVEDLRTAEALAAVASRFDPALWGPLAAARDSAMLACGLYYEHSFTAGPGVTSAQRAAWERSLQAALTSYVAALQSAAQASIAQRVAQTEGAERHIVFNPLSWTRDDAVDLISAIPEPRYVVDVTTGVTIPSQTVMVEGQPRLRVRMTGVPSVGYRVVEVWPGVGAGYPAAATVTLPSMDNGLIQVTLGTRGQITSFVDHTDANQQLVGPGHALNDLGNGTGTGTVTVESQGPVSVTLKLTAPSLLRDTRVTLFAGSKRVEVRNDIRENFSEDVGYTSRFNLNGMVMRHEEVGMIARVGRLSQGGDYANENTRTDWLTLNHFVDLSTSARGVTVSASDASFFQSGNSSILNLDVNSASVRTLVGGRIDGEDAGFADQGDDQAFLHRLAFGTHGAYDPAAAMRFALEHQNPLVGFVATGQAPGQFPDTTFSMLSIDSPEVLLWALKPAEEGPDQGLIARVWNLAEGPRVATLALPGAGLQWATRTTHIETDLAPAPLVAGQLPMALARQQLATFRLIPGNGVTGIPDPPEGTHERGELVAYPNPVRPGGAATLSFALAREGFVRLTIHDVTGARVATLLEGSQGAGRHEVSWRPGGSSAPVRPGLYFARLEIPGEVRSARIVRIE